MEQEQEEREENRKRERTGGRENGVKWSMTYEVLPRELENGKLPPERERLSKLMTKDKCIL